MWTRIHPDDQNDDNILDYGQTSADPQANKKSDIISEPTSKYMSVDKQRCKDFGDYFSDVMGSTL